MTRELETVIELQRALDALERAEELLEGIPDWMQELHAEHSGRNQEIAELEAAVEEARGDRREAESSVEDGHAKIRHYQEQISQVRNQREYAALLQEIDTVREQIRQAEERGLAAMERQDVAQRPLEEKREAFQELDERYAEALSRWESEKPEVAAEAERLRGRVEVLQERLPLGVLALFQRIRERHEGRALAALLPGDRSGRGGQTWHCEACQYRVRPQVAVEIRNRGSVVQCDSCKRILYIEEAGG